MDLVGETKGHRKKAPLPITKCGATRIKRYKTEGTITHSRGRVIVELPKNFDMRLVPEGSYRLEAIPLEQRTGYVHALPRAARRVHQD